MQLSVLMRSLNCFVYLIKLGFDKERRIVTYSGVATNLLHFACISDSSDILSYLIFNLNYDVSEYVNISPIHIAATFGSIECFKILLKVKGVFIQSLVNNLICVSDVRCKSNNLINIMSHYVDSFIKDLRTQDIFEFMKLCVISDNYEFFNFFLDKIPSLSNCSPEASATFDILCEKGSVVYVRLMLKKGMRIGISRFNPLACAVRGRNFEIIKILLEHGADMYNCILHNDFRTAPLFLISKFKNDEASVSLIKEIISLFLSHGYDINYRVGNRSIMTSTILLYSPDLINFLFRSGFVLSNEEFQKCNILLKDQRQCLLTLIRNYRKTRVSSSSSQSVSI